MGYIDSTSSCFPVDELVLDVNQPGFFLESHSSLTQKEFGSPLQNSVPRPQ